ncbi:MAG: hypothetical protein E7242_04380 [Lachnospiraceae bacterium]|nr:hypothetical protein [Lachnospiraceae bacterium]
MFYEVRTMTEEETKAFREEMKRWEEEFYRIEAFIDKWGKRLNMQLETMTKKQRNDTHELFQRLLKKKSISELTMDKILIPLQKMNNEEGNRYVIALTKIVETSKTDSEIIKKAQEEINKMCDEKRLQL